MRNGKDRKIYVEKLENGLRPKLDAGKRLKKKNNLIYCDYVVARFPPLANISDSHAASIMSADVNILAVSPQIISDDWQCMLYNVFVLQVPVIENSVCQEMFQTAGHSKIILHSFLCAGYANGQKDSCEVIFIIYHYFR